jgi:hypothetical protein
MQHATGAPERLFVPVLWNQTLPLNGVRTGVRFYVRAKVLTLLCLVVHYDYAVFDSKRAEKRNCVDSSRDFTP